MVAAQGEVGGGVLVAGQVAGEEAVEVAGDDGEGGVQVDVERHAGRPCVEAESADVGVELVFDEHPFGVAGEQVVGGGGVAVGDQQGWSRPMLRTASWRAGAATPLRVIVSWCRWGWR